VTCYLEERRDAFGVEPICAAIGVPVSTYYARRSRRPSRRSLEDRRLVREIYVAREGYRSVYGVRKTCKELKQRRRRRPRPRRPADARRRARGRPSRQEEANDDC
jgi:putative transposase